MRMSFAIKAADCSIKALSMDGWGDSPTEGVEGREPSVSDALELETL
jgi:hypothetical protein